jgi:fibro-slime domain-containing protein
VIFSKNALNSLKFSIFNISNLGGFMQKILSIFAIALAVSFSSAFAQYELDVIYRDFPANADGFEFFDTDRWGNGVCAGSNPDAENKLVDSASNRICFTGTRYHYCDEGNGTPLRYGQNNCDDNASDVQRGYCNGPDKLWNDRACPNDGNNPICWANQVYVTRGMVQNELEYDVNCAITDGEDSDPDFIKYRYCAKPKKGNGGCQGDNVVQWFTDGGQAKRIDDVIELTQQNDGTYVIEYNFNTKTNWNGHGTDRGFFPLDKYANPNSSDYSEGKTYGWQSLNVWCPGGTGYGYGFGDDCTRWRQEGGPTNPDAARRTASARNIMNKLHNYGFSAAGTAAFKYWGKDEVFEFIGDDDMWIFIDGKLEADLGGTHLAAPAKLNMKELADKHGWDTNGSKHAINFFYLDRQTNDMNFKLKMSIADMSGSRFGAPFIKKSETTVDGDNATTLLYVSTKLNLDYIRSTFKGNLYGIIVKRNNGEICGLEIKSIEYSGDGKSEGQVYKMTSSVICADRIPKVLISGDSLSFNIDKLKSERDGYNNPFALPDNVAPIKNETGREADKIILAPNTNKLGLPSFQAKIPDDSPVKDPFYIDQMFDGGAGRNGASGPIGTISGEMGGVTAPNLVSNAPSMGTTTDKVNSFGAIGNTLPSNMTGELILTAYPSQQDPKYKDYIDSKFFGLPPSANPGCASGLCGIADPSSQNKVDGAEDGVTGGFAFVKNGWSNSKNEGSVDGSLQLSPTRCTAKINGKDAKVNCLSFNLTAAQPFQIAVTVYDQLGNFVTQYRETVTEQEFRYVTQGPNYSREIVDNDYLPEKTDKCKLPTATNYGQKDVMTTNGLVNANINIYPFSQTGRKFGNGVYLVKVDRVDLPFEGCFDNGGIADWGKYSFTRYNTDIRFGWMRAK